MDSVITRSLLAALTMVFVIISQPVQAQRLCTVTSKSGMTMDERDDLRLKCLKKNTKNLDVNRCLKIAATMEYSINADEARQACLYELAKNPTGNECLQITRSMEFPDTSDDARWACLLKPDRKISRKTCLILAREMNYPANQERAQLFCSEEVPR